MPLTTKEITDMGQFIWRISSKYIRNSISGKQFEQWLTNTRNNPPTPNNALLQLYDFYKKTSICEPALSHEIQWGLFKLLGIPLPKVHGLCFFIWTCKNEVVDSKSLNYAIQRLETEINKVRHPEAGVRRQALNASGHVY